jgi:glycosyltransferase involved in cell wall biosynthesis
LRQLWAALEPLSDRVNETAADNEAVRRSNGAVVCVIIPCLDEESAIGGVVEAVRAQGVAEIIVVDGGSRDHTVELAAAAGARVVIEKRRGYGLAVQAGIAALPDDTDVVVFIDGDGSDRAELIRALVLPIVEGQVAFVHGSRIRGEREAGSLSVSQIVAGYVAGLLLHLIYGAHFTDMSPFRAIRRDTLLPLGMRETTYGWNLEMLMRVAAADIPCAEIPVGQRRRLGGSSKVSGNPVAAIKAAWSILATFIRLAISLRREQRA